MRTSGGASNLRLNAPSTAERDAWVDAIADGVAAAAAAMPAVADLPAAIAELRRLLVTDEFQPKSAQYTTAFEHDCLPNGGLKDFAAQTALCGRYEAYLADGLLGRMIVGNRVGGLAEAKAYLPVRIRGARARRRSCLLPSWTRSGP